MASMVLRGQAFEEPQLETVVKTRRIADVLFEEGNHDPTVSRERSRLLWHEASAGSRQSY